MSQEQPQRPQTEREREEPHRYGDAPAMQEAAFGRQAPQGGAAAPAMQFTEDKNVLGQQYAQPMGATQEGAEGGASQQSVITIGQALEAVARAAGDKPVEQSDAAAIQAAEKRATGVAIVVPGGLTALVIYAANFNDTVTRDEDKIKLGEVLAGATDKLSADRAVTREDAEEVRMAEIRNNPKSGTHPGGVAESLAAAARLNENVNA